MLDNYVFNQLVGVVKGKLIREGYKLYLELEDGFKVPAKILNKNHNYYLNKLLTELDNQLEGYYVVYPQSRNLMAPDPKGLYQIVKFQILATNSHCPEGFKVNEFNFRGSIVAIDPKGEMLNLRVMRDPRLIRELKKSEERYKFINTFFSNRTPLKGKAGGLMEGKAFIKDGRLIIKYVKWVGCEVKLPKKKGGNKKAFVKKAAIDGGIVEKTRPIIKEKVAIG